MDEDDFDNANSSGEEDEDQEQEPDPMEVDEEDDGEDADDGDDDNDNDNDDDDNDNDNDNENENENENDDEDNEQDPKQESNVAVTLTSPSPRAAAPASGESLPFYPSVRQEALNAPVYDIIPTIAAPHSTSINAITATPDMRWVFSGGADGYIRKFNWVDTANGKLALTVAQRHPFVDTVTKAGVLLSYWENEDSNAMSESLSPVYSLAVQHQALWLLSGLDSGGINLQTVRHQEGTRIHTLKNHTSAVSVLTLAQDETSVLSGSWDKTINDWDLNTGEVKRKFETSGGQISAIEQRPLSTLPIPQDTEILPVSNGTFSSNNASQPRANGSLSNGADATTRTVQEEANEDAPGSPDDSLFGDGEKDSLFGDGQENNPTSGLQSFGDDDDEFSRAIANGIQQADEDANDFMGGPVQAPQEQTEESAKEASAADSNPPVANGTTDTQTTTTTATATANGLPHSEDIIQPANSTADQTEQPESSETTFLDASMDGSLRIWDRRQPNPVARITPSRNTPPWCMNACWSPDGNFIYAGRRNGTVDEYSLHKGLREPRRTFRFPGVSGPVSAVRAMPNGKHLICASYDILRLYDLTQPDAGTKGAAATPFLIVPGHRTGVVSQLYLDPTCTFMISTGGNRGWEGASTEVMLGYEIGIGS